MTHTILKSEIMTREETSRTFSTCIIFFDKAWKDMWKSGHCDKIYSDQYHLLLKKWKEILPLGTSKTVEDVRMFIYQETFVSPEEKIIHQITNLKIS